MRFGQLPFKFHLSVYNNWHRQHHCLSGYYWSYKLSFNTIMLLDRVSEYYNVPKLVKPF